MKKNLILLWCSLLTVALQAKVVSESQARAKAQQFFQQGAETRATLPVLRLEWNGEDASTRQTGEPAFYVYNRTDHPGFVVISGDDLVPTILGYSYEHSFQSKQMPDNLRLWMEHLRQQILLVRGGAFCTSTRSGDEVGDVVLKYETAQWDQTAPYNNECPLVNGKRAVTGCTATAFAIAMHYRRWPDQGEGTIPAYTSKGDEATIRVSARPLGVPYQWDLMPLKLTESSSEEEKAQVARLMADCGAMGESGYGQSTGSNSGTMLAGAVNYMKYDASAVAWIRDVYSDTQWMEMVKKELHDNGPVLYCGYTKKNEGHAFVLDGYTSNNYFSVNWGWSGTGNGYYLIDNLTPTAQGTGGSNSAAGFNYAQGAVIGFKKSTGTSQAEAHMALVAATTSDGTQMEGLSTQTSKVEKGVPFLVKAGFYMNLGIVDFTGYLALGHFDAQGNLIDIVGTIYTWDKNSIPPSYMTWVPNWECKLTAEPQVGDYIATLYKNSSDEENWRLVPCDKNAVGHLELRPESAVFASETSFSYDRKSQIATITTAPQVAWELKQIESGEIVKSGTTSEGNNTFQIVTSQLKGGSYNLSLKLNNLEKQIILKVKGTNN